MRIAATLTFGALLSIPMFAQQTPPASAPMDQTQPSTQTPAQTPAEPGQTMAPPSQNNVTTADLTGQAIYTKKGHKIGTVSAMSMGSHGDQVASVTMDRYLGMGGQTVLIPVSTLQQRTAGGYSTSLTSAQLKALPKANTSGMQ